MSCLDIARSCHEFWRAAGISVCPSYPVVHKDPTVLFVNAGVTPFKSRILAGEMLTPTALVQRCLRTHWEQDDLFRFDMMTVIGMASTISEITDLLFKLLSNDLGLESKRFQVILDKDDKDLLSAIGTNLNSSQIHQMKGNSASFWTRWTFGQHVLTGRGATVMWQTDIPPCGSSCDPYCACGRYLALGNIIVVENSQYSTAYLDIGFGIERLTEALGVEDAHLTESMTILENRFGNRLNAIERRLLLDRYDAAFTLIREGVVPSGRSAGYVLRKILRCVFEFLQPKPTPSLDHEAVETAAALLNSDQARIGTHGPLSQIIRDEAQRYLRNLTRSRTLALRYLIIHAGQENGALRAHLQGTYGLPQSEINALLDGALNVAKA